MQPIPSGVYWGLPATLDTSLEHDMCHQEIKSEPVNLSVRSHPWTYNNLNCSKFHFGMLKISAKLSVIKKPTMYDLKTEMVVSDSEELFFIQIKMLGDTDNSCDCPNGGDWTVI